MDRLEEIKQRLMKSTPGPLPKNMPVFEHDMNLFKHASMDINWLIGELGKAVDVIKFYREGYNLPKVGYSIGGREV